MPKASRARPAPDLVQGGGELGPGEAAPILTPSVLEVADPAGVGEARLGQHVPGIGLGVRRHLVGRAGEPGQATLQRGRRHRHLLVARAEQGVERIGLQPFRRGGGERPHMLTAVAELHVDDAVDCILDAVVIRVGRAVPSSATS